nr:hypothetical protein [Tanacetum cinerariifolium]
MFEKPDVEAQVWKNQRGVHSLAKVKSWILLFLWSAYHNIYNYTDDLACREKISINKIHFGSDAEQCGSESRPPMLNKENYVPWSSRVLRYVKSRPNGKLIHNSIINGPYADDELTEKELKQIEADDQAIQTILLDLPEDIYAAVDSCETA